MSQRTFVGRQPIVDRDQHVVAYELLFRASRNAEIAEIGDIGRAATRVMVNTFASLGMDAVLGRAQGFFNVNREVLLSEALEALPRERVVIEILEGVEADREVIARCRQLREHGFRLAADDWILDDPRGPLLPHLDLVKIDLPAMSERALRKLTRELQRHDIDLLAEKVESASEFEACHKLGFQLFQGYFFARPIVLEGAELDATKATLIKLLQQISTAAPTREIVETFKEDAKLGLNLLRLVNTAGMSARVELETIEDAVRHLGLERLARWVSILLYARDGGEDLQSPLLSMATHRARLMELVTGLGELPHRTSEACERAFLVGMLSLADALLSRPLKDLVRELQLGGVVARALTDREGSLGRLLALTEAIERSDLDAFEPELESWDLDLESLQRLEHEAYAWVHGLLRAPGSDDHAA